MKQVKASLLIRNTSDHTIKDVKVQFKTQQPRLFVKCMEPRTSYQHIFTIDETNAQFARGVHCGLDDLYISVRESFLSRKMLQVSPRTLTAVAKLKLNWLNRIRGLCDAIKPQIQFEVARQMQRGKARNWLAPESAQKTRSAAISTWFSNQSLDLWVLLAILALLVFGVYRTRNL